MIEKEKKLSEEKEIIERIKAKQKKIEDSLLEAAKVNPVQVKEGLDAAKKMFSALPHSLNPFEENAVRAVFYMKGKFDGLKEILELLEK